MQPPNTNSSSPEDILSQIIDNLTLTYSSNDTSTIKTSTSILDNLFQNFPIFFRGIISIIQANSPNISKQLKLSAVIYLKNKITSYIKSTNLLQSDISFISNQILSILLNPLTCLHYESIRDNLNLLLFQIVSTDIFLSNSSLTINMLIYLEQTLLNSKHNSNNNKSYFLISKEILAIFTILINSRNIVRDNINEVIVYLCKCINFIFEQTKNQICDDNFEIMNALYEFLYILLLKHKSIYEVIITNYLQYSIDLIVLINIENDIVYNMKSSILKVIIELMCINKNNSNISLSNAIPFLLENIIKILELSISKYSTNINSNNCDNITTKYCTLLYYMIIFINTLFNLNIITNYNDTFMSNFILKIIFPLIIFPTPPYSSIIIENKADDSALYYEYINDIVHEHKLKTPLTAISLLLKTISSNYPDIFTFILNYIYQMLSFLFQNPSNDDTSSLLPSLSDKNNLYINSKISKEYISTLNWERLIFLGFNVIVILHNEIRDSKTFSHKYKMLILSKIIQLHYIKVSNIKVFTFKVYEMLIRDFFIKENDQMSINRCIHAILNTIIANASDLSSPSIVEFIATQILINIMNSSNICLEETMFLIAEFYNDIFKICTSYYMNTNYIELISLILTHSKLPSKHNNLLEEFITKLVNNLQKELNSTTSDQTKNEPFIYQSFNLLMKYLKGSNKTSIPIKRIQMLIKPIIEIIKNPDKTIYEDEIISLSVQFMLLSDQIEECAIIVLNKIKKCADKHKLFTYQMFNFMLIFLNIDESSYDKLQNVSKYSFFIDKIIHSPKDNNYNDVMSFKYQILLICKMLSLNMEAISRNTKQFNNLIQNSYEIAFNNKNIKISDDNYQIMFIQFASIASICIAFIYYCENTLLIINDNFDKFILRLKECINNKYNSIPSLTLLQAIIIGLSSLLLNINSVNFIINKGNVNDISQLLLFVYSLLQMEIKKEQKMMLRLTMVDVSNNAGGKEQKENEEVLTQEEWNMMSKYIHIDSEEDDDEDIVSQNEILKHATELHLKQKMEDDVYYNDECESANLVDMCKFKFQEKDEFKLFVEVTDNLNKMGFEEQVNIFKRNIDINEYNEILYRKRVKIQFNNRDLYTSRRIVKIKRKENI